jgi:hypothetical protein
MEAPRGIRLEGVQEMAFVESGDATLSQGSQYRGGVNLATTRRLF